MAKAVITSFGLTRVGEHWNKDIISIAYEAAKTALSASGFDDVDAIYVGNMLADSFMLQGNLGAYLADELGLSGIPSVRVEAAGVSGLYSIVEAAYAVESGRYDVVLAGGVEKLSDSMPEDVYEALNLGEDMYIMSYTGLTSAGLNAILMRLYMDRYNVGREKITSLAVLDHSNSIYSPHAQFRSKISLELAMSAPIIADPLSIFDSYAIGDGSAFVIVASRDMARELGLDYIEISGIGIATNYLSISERPDPLWFDATERAVARALSMAGISLGDIDVAEIHDEYTITGVLALESLGFSGKGCGGDDVWRGRYSLNGEIPINTFGGLKARGNPIGATGAYQVSEVFMQLMGRAEGNQVDGARIGLVHNMGGLDNTSIVMVLRGGGGVD
jgi:acetyl-CoA C-acetyltransferase